MEVSSALSPLFPSVWVRAQPRRGRHPFGSRLESRSKERAGSGLGCGSRGIRIATLRGVRAMLIENGIRRFTNIPQLRFRASLTEDGSRRVILWKAQKVGLSARGRTFGD